MSTEPGLPGFAWNCRLEWNPEGNDRIAIRLTDVSLSENAYYDAGSRSYYSCRELNNACTHLEVKFVILQLVWEVEGRKIPMVQGWKSIGSTESIKIPPGAEANGLTIQKILKIQVEGTGLPEAKIAIYQLRKAALQPAAAVETPLDNSTVPPSVPGTEFVKKEDGSKGRKSMATGRPASSPSVSGTTPVVAGIRNPPSRPSISAGWPSTFDFGLNKNHVRFTGPGAPEKNRENGIINAENVTALTAEAAKTSSKLAGQTAVAGAGIMLISGLVQNSKEKKAANLLAEYQTAVARLEEQESIFQQEYRKYLPEINAGDKNAMLYLAKRYYTLFHVYTLPDNLTRSKNRELMQVTTHPVIQKLIEKAGALGHKQAMLLQSVQQLENSDEASQALETLDKLATEGLAEASLFLGEFYNDPKLYPAGQHLRPNIEKSVYWLEKGGAQGSKKCWFYLGHIYSYERMTTYARYNTSFQSGRNNSSGDYDAEQLYRKNTIPGTTRSFTVYNGYKDLSKAYAAFEKAARWPESPKMANIFIWTSLRSTAAEMLSPVWSVSAPGESYPIHALAELAGMNAEGKGCPKNTRLAKEIYGLYREVSRVYSWE